MQPVQATEGANCQRTNRSYRAGNNTGRRYFVEWLRLR